MRITYPVFESYPAIARLREMEKILVQWSDGRSKGTTSLVRKSAIKTGTIAVGEKVVVCWGKSKKTYNAQVIGLSSTHSPASPATTQNAPADQFCFDVADPAPSTADQCAPEGQQKDRFSTILQALDSLSEKIDSFSDTLSGVEARLVHRLRMLEERVSALQLPRENPPQPVTPMPSFTMEMATPFSPSQETLQTPMESPQPLCDVSSRFNETDYCIQAEDISFALTACRSRRNLAARLAAKVFSPQQHLGSNCRGVLGKKALNGPKVKAIFNACMQHFPLQRLESASSSEKEMRNAIDEVCRKTKFPAVGGAENDFLT